MLIPAYCPEDSGGPLSQQEALALLKLMQKRSGETISENQDAGCDLRAFDHACGAREALEWCQDLIERMQLNPQLSRDAMIKSAETLEKEARQLRILAGGFLER